MLKTAIAPACLFLALATQATAQTTRSSDAHVHGSGTVSVAIDGPVLDLTVETPAYDVLGFEHAARTAEDRWLVSAVRSLLENPQALFDLPPSAGCSLTGTEVAIGPESDAARAAGQGGDVHSEIAARYVYRCADVAALDRIGFPWFEAFPLSRELDVVVLSGRGQFSGEIGPGTPDLRLR